MSVSQPSPVEAQELGLPATIALYRITQKALRNLAKHAGKTHLKVILEAQQGTLRLEVRDSDMDSTVDLRAICPNRVWA